MLLIDFAVKREVEFHSKKIIPRDLRFYFISYSGCTAEILKYQIETVVSKYRTVAFTSDSTDVYNKF